MYSDEWEPAMTADTMEEHIDELAAIARERADEREQTVEAVVHDMMHGSYLLKHTTGDVLRELDRLQKLYPDAFYDGEANEYLVSRLDDAPDFEYWHDYVNLALTAGLEWAILQNLKGSTVSV